MHIMSVILFHTGQDFKHLGGKIYSDMTINTIMRIVKNTINIYSVLRILINHVLSMMLSLAWPDPIPRRGVITFSISALFGKGSGTVYSVHSVFTLSNVLI